VAYKILFTEDALLDLESILDFVGADKSQAAEQFGTALLNHVELLQNFPRLGAPNGNVLASVRSFILPFASITGFTKSGS
jgi:plasmid stabilization system protein ParE